MNIEIKADKKTKELVAATVKHVEAVVKTSNQNVKIMCVVSTLILAATVAVIYLEKVSAPAVLFLAVIATIILAFALAAMKMGLFDGTTTTTGTTTPGTEQGKLEAPVEPEKAV